MVPAPEPASSFPFKACRRCRGATLGADLCTRCAAARRSEIELAAEYGEAPRTFSAFCSDGGAS